MPDSYHPPEKQDNVGSAPRKAEIKLINHELSLVELTNDFGNATLASSRRGLPHRLYCGYRRWFLTLGVNVPQLFSQVVRYPLHPILPEKAGETQLPDHHTLWCGNTHVRGPSEYGRISAVMIRHILQRTVQGGMTNVRKQRNHHELSIKV